MTVCSDTETRDRVVSAIGRKQTPSIGRDNDAGRALKGIRRALLAADRLESSGTRAAREATLHLGKLAVHRTLIVHNRVPSLIRLHIEMSYTLIRHPRFLRHTHFFRHIALLEIFIP